ncbi:thiamine pyrophosphate-dependent enzyme [Edaphobacter flagellatus]|uniref:thiamine pyrophosphate-dependent enzyme n=1 Tax=Edaphobacter flagellatus TaxID=1933044 RepID=UPI0021B37A5B|nr:thiamine pyrophosphate-dependent enzyme [Edaphobacter flagellatus]
MAVKDKKEAGENPLVPNAKLRAMYVAMIEARTLEDTATAKARGKGRRLKLTSIRGQEAVRTSTAIELGADDLISDYAPSAGMGSILGDDPIGLLKAFSSGKNKKIPRLLPTIEDSEQRVEMAIGAALALKTQGRQGVVVVYIGKNELSSQAYARLLKPAAHYELPIIFVVLPGMSRRKDDDDLAVVAKMAGKSGVPGIPVDSCDAVALYRVTQESLGRTRSGDGPVLIECVFWPTARNSKSALSDPMEHMEQFLLGRKIVTPAWLKQASKAARRRLKTIRRASK